jgi:glutaconate CoA-transferase subunit A
VQNQEGEINYRKQHDKRMTLHDAIKTFVKNNSTISFGGMGSNVPIAASHEIARQGMSGLTAIGDSPSLVIDLLIGTGQIKKLEIGWLGYGVSGQALNFRRAVEHEVPHKIELEEYSNYAIGLHLLAAAMNIPYLPTRSIVGSDICKYNKRIKIQDDPFTGQSLALIPAADLDVAMVHVQFSDQQGNCQIFGHSSSSETMAKAAKHTIVTCEKIVSNEWIRKAPSLTSIPQYCVDSVIEVPCGSHPHNCVYMYEYDYPYTAELLRAFKTREGFLDWVDKNVMQVPDWETHLEQYGWDKLKALQEVDKKYYELPYKGVQ